MNDRDGFRQQPVNPLKAIHNSVFMIRNNYRLLISLRLSTFLILFLLLWPLPIYLLGFLMLTGCTAWILKSNGDLWNPYHELGRWQQGIRRKRAARQRTHRAPPERTYDYD